MSNFVHLHCHTQYSLLDGASSTAGIVKKAKTLGMKAVAITDHGNMFGVKEFFDKAKAAGIKPIVGCEMYVARRSHKLSSEKVDRSGDHLIVLAKNKTGYHNLVRLVSKSWVDGFYFKPRIDEELLWKHSEGLIISSACLGGTVPRALRHEGLEAAEKVALRYKEKFGEDYYLELMDHGLEKQKLVNEGIKKLSKKLGIKMIATNDAHFLEKDDAQAHDILVCLSTGAEIDAQDRLRYTGQEYFKTEAEMLELFPDVPEALSNTLEIVDKIEDYSLSRPVMLPAFPLPEGFTNQDDYLRHLTYEGAKAPHRDPAMTEDIRERLDYELKVVREMGFAGYFLIVQDFIAAARAMGVWVGPGRGSAAGSAVAFCTGITNVDPIKYKLLFERFLNPERVSMPDIDIDFDEDGRDRVLAWVADKYGHDHVAHIITFGTMAAKSSIADVARVLKLPLSESTRLTKMVPEKPGTTLAMAFEQVPELAQEQHTGEPLVRHTLRMATTLEGSVRQTGIHACGVIIGPEPLDQHIPISTNKKTDMLVTQYEGKQIEDVGMLKMDFLGLKTLSIIKEAIENVKLSKGIDIDPDMIPLEDPKTFELYQKGDTVGTFQFESDGMRKYLRMLRPTNIEDLIAMNALYRPGPMDYIPSFVDRKHGREKLEYPHALLADILKDTNGIMVYQEQIMQAAQIMGGFTLGSADILRRAMGKKKADEMEKQKSIFVEGAILKGIGREKAVEVFDVMAKFASYGFNRSHAAAYSILAYQTGYLKANHPGEFMAALLSRNMSDIKKLTGFMDECRRMHIPVKGPDLNESYARFTVNSKGEIRFGLAGIKGVGEALVDEIVRQRESKGPFKDLFDFAERVPANAMNRKNIESLAAAGCFDSFPGIERHQFFLEVEKDLPFSNVLVKYAQNHQGQTGGMTLFGGSDSLSIPKPKLPEGQPWGTIERLNREKELVGIYLSAHPLDQYRMEIGTFCNTELAELQNADELARRGEIKVAGIVTEVEHRTTKTGNPFGSITLEDFSGTHKITFFGQDYLSFKTYFTNGYSLFLKGSMQPRFGKAGDLELKVNQVQMLSELKEKGYKNLALKIDLARLDRALLDRIEAQVARSPGNVGLSFLLFDPETRVWVQAASRSHKVGLSQELTDFLAQNDITYKLD